LYLCPEPSVYTSGFGGNSIFGGGAAAIKNQSATGQNGINGRAYGGGGSGTATSNLTGNSGAVLLHGNH
jgi:hypothetical protein